MIELNAPKGLGDAIYLRAIVLHLIERGESITVFTSWPDVFSDLTITIKPADEIETAVKLRHVTYSARGSHGPTNAKDQFRIACYRLSLADVQLRMNWRVRNHTLLARVKRLSKGRKILVYQPIKLANNPLQELLHPEVGPFNRFVEGKAEYFRIKIGHLAYVTPEAAAAPCDLDLVGQTSVPDIFDLGTIADLIYSEPCFLVVLAEAMDKPLVCMFSRRGLSCSNKRISVVTPELIFNKPHLATALFDDQAR